jgi:hypothetical protein
MEPGAHHGLDPLGASGPEVCVFHEQVIKSSAKIERKKSAWPTSMGGDPGLERLERRGENDRALWRRREVA